MGHRQVRRLDRRAATTTASSGVNGAARNVICYPYSIPNILQSMNALEHEATELLQHYGERQLGNQQVYGAYSRIF